MEVKLAHHSSKHFTLRRKGILEELRKKIWITADDIKFTGDDDLIAQAHFAILKLIKEQTLTQSEIKNIITTNKWTLGIHSAETANELAHYIYCSQQMKFAQFKLNLEGLK